MDDDKTLRSALEAIMAARRDELGEPPRADELLAFRDGALPPAQRAVVEEKIAAFPEAAAALLDLGRFPDVAPAPGVREVTDEEIAGDWQSLRARIERDRPPAPAPSGTRGILRLAAAVVAALLLGALSGLILGRGPLGPPARPAAGVDLIALEPDDADSVTRGQAVAVASGPPLLFILAAGAVEPLPAYSVHIRDARGELVWSQTGAAPTREGLVTVLLPAGFLEAGRYRIDLSPPDGGEPLASYTLLLQRDDSP